ncbi:hypothetical protein ACFY1P_19835 [Streptomyces sp. NPDC001407]|uniref:hypothetical protein n=1 Tax=Streptomyces sp. NPDC001407 TaxID=3364573 RepID=UPI0036D18CC3
MTDYAEKYAEALDPGVLQRFTRSTVTENAETALAGWISPKGLPEHHMWLAAVMFRSYNGDSTLKAALALADDTGRLAWSPDAMSERSTRVQALASYRALTDEVGHPVEEHNRLIRAVLPLYGVDTDAVDIDLARALFETTLPGDEYGRSSRIRQLLRRLRSADAASIAPLGGDAR